MNAGTARPMSHGAAILLQDAQQLAGLLVQRAHAAAMGLDGMPPGEGWQPVEVGPGVLAWATPEGPPQPPPSAPPTP